MSDYLWLIGFALGTVVVLAVARMYLRPFFKRILLCTLPLALAGWVGGEAISRQAAPPVNVAAGPITETAGARLDRSVEFRAEIVEQQGQERVNTPTPAISISVVESLA